MRAVLLCSAVLGLMVPNAAQADEVVLEPSSKWVLDYHPDRCRLVRTFGTGNNKHFFQLEQSRPSSVLSWLVAGPIIKHLPNRREVEVRFGPSFGSMSVRKDPDLTLGEFGPVLSGADYQPFVQDSIVVTDAGLVKNKEEATASSDAPTLRSAEPVSAEPRFSLAVEDGKQINSFTITNGKRDQVTFVLGNMGSAFKAMNDCADDLVRSWGLDPAVLRTQTTNPQWTNMPALARMIQQRYPSAALARGEQANFQLRVMVGTDGRPTSCAFVELTKAENFSDRVCPIIMSEATFVPATDSSGRPIPSFHQSRILYRMP